MKVQEEYQQLVGIVRPPTSALILRKPQIRPSTTSDNAIKPNFMHGPHPSHAPPLARASPQKQIKGNNYLTGGLKVSTRLSD